MLIFNEYFGYPQPLRNSIKRKLKRAEASCERTGDSIQHQHYHRKTMYLEQFFTTRPKSVESPTRNSSRSLKFNLFKSVRKRSFTKQRKSIRVDKKKRISEHDRQLYDRFMKEDFHTRKQKVENTKDLQILNFLNKKEKEKDQSVGRFRKRPEGSPTYKIKPQSSKKYIPIQSFEKESPKNSLIKNNSNKKRGSQNQRSVGSLVLNGEETDYHRKEVDEYQINTGRGSRVKNPASLKLWRQLGSQVKLKEYQQNQEFEDRNMVCIESVESRINGYYQELQKLLTYVDDIKKTHEKNIQPFKRQIYLCRKMYYSKICQMRDCLKGEPVKTSNCFKLKQIRITDRQLRQHIAQSPPNLNLRIRQLESQTQAMQESLTEESKELMAKYSNDPYIRFQNNNFQTELVNEIYEEVLELTEKLHNDTLKNKGEFLKKRANAMEIMVLVAQICGFRREVRNYNQSSLQNIFQENHKILETIVEKFQQMPL